ACDRSSCTGPSREQAAAETTSKARRTLLTRMSFLRSRTFTAASFSGRGLGCVETLRMYQASDFLQTFAYARSRPEYLIRVVRINTPFFYRRNRFEIAPPSRRSGS